MDAAPLGTSSPPSSLLASLDLVTFDCFGTLVDWQKALPALGVDLDRMPVFLRESERHQRPQRRDAPFVEYRSLLEHVGAILRPDLAHEEIARWARGFGELPFFDDTVASMQLLARVVDLGVISNCDAVHQLDVARRIGRPWDVVVVAEELEAYKPTDRAWDRAVAAVERRGYDKSRWLHVSAWEDYDLAPAAARGVRTAFVPRPGGVPPRLDEATKKHQGVDASFPDLLELARSIAKEKGGPVAYDVDAKAKDAATMDRFLAFLDAEHLSEIRACVGVRSAEVVRLDATHARAAYRFTGRAAYARYLERDAPSLRARTRAVFAEDEIFFTRSEGLVVAAR